MSEIICEEQNVSLQKRSECLEVFDLVVITAPGPQALELIPDGEDKPELDYDMEPCFCTMLALEKGAYALDEDAVRQWKQTLMVCPKFTQGEAGRGRLRDTTRER